MNKNLAISLTALSALALSACSEKDQKGVPLEYSSVQGTLIDVQISGSGENGIWYLIDTDNNPSTAEYTGCLWHLYTPDEILEAYNDKQAKPTMSLAQWNKKLNLLRKAPEKTRE